MHEATFRIEGRGPYAHATTTGDTEIELWCNDHCDLLHVRGDDAASAVSIVEREVGIQDERARGADHLVITKECLTHRDEDTIDAYLARHGCLLLPPLTYREGAKHCRVLALDPATLTAVYRDLTAEYRVDVVEKHELATPTREGPIRSVDALLPALTDRQRSILQAAHDAGYYRIPRDVTTAELAAEFGLDRRTVEDHLRRAENKLLGALVENDVI